MEETNQIYFIADQFAYHSVPTGLRLRIRRSVFRVVNDTEFELKAIFFGQRVDKVFDESLVAIISLKSVAVVWISQHKKGLFLLED